MNISLSQINQKFVTALSPSELRDILENSSSEIIEKVSLYLRKPTKEEYANAHSLLNDGIYDVNGKITGEKNPDD